MKKYIDNLKNGLYASWFGISNNWGSSSFSTVDGIVAKVTEVMNTAIFASALVAVAVMIYGAVNMIISAGDSEKYEGGVKAVENAVIGMIVVFLAATIIKYVVAELFK